LFRAVNQSIDATRAASSFSPWMLKTGTGERMTPSDHSRSACHRL
jgi:hypothetical protein